MIELGHNAQDGHDAANNVHYVVWLAERRSARRGGPTRKVSKIANCQLVPLLQAQAIDVNGTVLRPAGSSDYESVKLVH